MTSPIDITRLTDGPIVPPPGTGDPEGPHQNINGPSLIKVPDWVERPLGRYYLYYADHKGKGIKLAYADALEGPWRVHPAGALALSDTPYLKQPPEVPEGTDVEALAIPRGPGVPSPLQDCTIPHIASPEVIVDEAARKIRLYYHGLNAFMIQISRVAVSDDGLHFEAQDEVIAPPYLRMFAYRDTWYGLAMPGSLWRSDDGLTNFVPGPNLFEPNMRHAALWLRGETLWVFWTRVGDAPERILLSTIDVSGDFSQWKETEPIEVLRPERDYEGGNLPVEKSLRSCVDHRVNQLRDPAIYLEGDDVYLVYAVAGESGLAIARIRDAGA